MTTKLFSYERKITYKDDLVEVVEITWPVGSRSVAHDHGNSHGLVRVLAGRIFCDTYNKATKQFKERIEASVGEVLLETPDIIHVMGNASESEEARTVHIYTPPLTMTRYEEGDLVR